MILYVVGLIIFLTAASCLVAAYSARKTPQEKAEAEFQDWLAHNLQYMGNPSGKHGQERIAETRARIYADRGLAVPPQPK